MDLVPFGRQLFRSKDLDPVYVALLQLNSGQGYIARWLVAYWCFYHCGFACWAAERTGAKFWAGLLAAAENKTNAAAGGRWPRGSERRHFRGVNAAKAVTHLARRYEKPEEMLDWLCSGSMTVAAVVERVKFHYLFGDWISFKVADMLDAVVGVPVVQDDVSVFLYNTPLESIQQNIERGVVPLKVRTDNVDDLEAAMHWLQNQLSDCRIPHKPKQKPDWFSLETVWCKHLSHLHGHYPLGKDIREIRHGLEPWALVAATAKDFLKAMPSGFVPEENSIWDTTSR